MSDLPSGWEATALSAVLELNPKTTDLADDTMVGFVPMALLGTSYLDTIAFQPRPWAEVKRGYTHFRDGDVLLAKITPCFENGKAGLASGLPNGVGAGSTEYFVCRPREGAVDARYLLAFLKSSAFVSDGAAQMTGSVGHKRVPKEYLSERHFPLPPRREQTRIADQLDSLLVRVNACNDHLDAIPGILKRFRRAVLQSAVAGYLTAEKRAASGWPDAWEPTPLHKLGELGRGKSRHRPRNDARLYGGPYPFIQTGDVAQSGGTITRHSQTYSEFGLQQSKLWPAGTICITIAANIADTAVLTYPACFPDSVVGFIADQSKCVDVFVKWSIDVIKNDLEAFAPATAQKNINLSVLNDVVIRCPSLEEQREIVRQVQSLLAAADRIESSYTNLRAQAQRLAPQVLAKAFRGELVEQDPQDEPVSVLLQRLATSQPTKASASRGRPRSRPKAQPAAPDGQPADWVSLPNDAWAAPADPDGQAAAVWLTAVLRAWREPMPERTARLASLLCHQPRLFTTVLPATQAELWSRLVGDEAKPLPGNVGRFQPSTNSHWGRAIKGMRGRGDLIEVGAGDEVKWTLGPGAASIETAGWPDGRAGFVVAHLRAHGVESILPSLEPAVLEFVDARAA